MTLLGHEVCSAFAARSAARRHPSQLLYLHLCPQCQFKNREGIRFCEQCGTKLEPACHSCGATLPLGRKVCGECGPLATTDGASPATAVEETHRAPVGTPAPDGERRQFTFPSADLSGYTELSRNLDPEETHGLLNRFFDAVDPEMQNYGGRVDKHIGDSVMAVFGVPAPTPTTLCAPSATRSTSTAPWRIWRAMASTS